MDPSKAYLEAMNAFQRQIKESNHFRNQKRVSLIEQNCEFTSDNNRTESIKKFPAILNRINNEVEGKPSGLQAFTQQI